MKRRPTVLLPAHERRVAAMREHIFENDACDSACNSLTPPSEDQPGHLSNGTWESAGGHPIGAERTFDVQPWRLTNNQQALDELRRVLRIDAVPPSLNPLPFPCTPSSSNLQPTDLISAAVSASTPSDAIALLRDAQELLSRLGLGATTPETFRTQCEIWYDRMALVRPQYVTELMDRVDALLQQYNNTNRAAPPTSITAHRSNDPAATVCNAEQLREVRECVTFLENEFAPHAAAAQGFVKQLRTLMPLLSAASLRLSTLSVLVRRDGTTDPNQLIRDAAQRIESRLAALGALIDQSSASLGASIAALTQRHEEVAKRRRQRQTNGYE